MTTPGGGVLVVGSANVDLVYGVEHFPDPGETIIATGASRHPGGKGNNQIIAAARAGAPATFVAAIGDDANGDYLADVASGDGVTTMFRRRATRTGTALITVDANGENIIVVDSGANAELIDLSADELAAVAAADILLLQLEVPMDTVVAAAEHARANDTTVVLNAAPFQPLADGLLDVVDILVVNEGEAAALGPSALDSVAAVVTTLGGDGVRVVADGETTELPAADVIVADTTGAGDTFCGALCAALGEGRSLVDAARFASIAAGISVQRPGAVSSIPTRKEIDEVTRDPLVPRPLDEPTVVDLDVPLADIADALDRAKIFVAPDDPGDWERWRRRLADWRDDARRRHDYDGCAYDDPRTAWASCCYSVAIAWLWDERLFDHDAGRFTPERYLDACAAYGGIDGVVLWHAYPIIGIDERNQFDFYRDVPGLADLVAWFRDRDIRVFVDYNPWDTGGRGGTVDHGAETVALVDELGVDGVFLDTMREGGALVDALRALDPPMVLEGESTVPLERIVDHQISWAQWFADSDVPGVIRAHWYERRHQLHHTRRWNRDHHAELQSSWINGTGVVLWDCVFGSWVGWSERDQDSLRRMLRVQRACHDLLIDGEWTPLAPLSDDAHAAGVYASSWQSGDVTLWTLVNRGDTDFAGPLLAAPPVDGSWLDVTTGRSIGAAVDVVVPARGIAGVVHVGGAVPAWLDDLAAAAADDGPPAPTTDVVARTPQRVPVARSIGEPDGPVIVIEPGDRSLTIEARRRETGLYAAAPWREEWKPLPPRLHARFRETIEVAFTAAVVATREVTVGDYNEFCAATERAPIDGSVDEVVTNVSFDLAVAYATWRGARLPTEHEWQIAADAPSFDRGDPAVWNWTASEHRDGATRFVILKGGATYEATASEWYFDGGVRPPEFSAKYLLAGLGVDASANIGFRLAWDR